MATRVLHEPRFVNDRTIDLSRRNYILLRASVAHDRAAFMKEVENSVMHVAVPHSEFMNVIAQVVCFWAPQFVAAFGEPFDANGTFVASLDIEVVHPRQQRRRTILSGKDHNLCLRHSAFPRRNTIAFLRCVVNAILRYPDRR
jgi:hypothetical protein